MGGGAIIAPSENSYIDSRKDICTQGKDEGPMTLLELFALLKKHLRLVVALPVACALVCAVVSYGFLPNTYTATTSMYVLAKTGDGTSNTLNSDLTASQQLTNDVSTLLKSSRVETQTAGALGLKDLSDYKIDVTSSTTSRVISLSVTGTDPAQTAEVANGLAQQVSAIAQEVMNVDSVNVVDQAQTPESPSGPRRPLYVAVAFLAGLFLAVAFVVVEDMVNTRVRSQEELEELVGLPVMGRIPAMKEAR